MGLGVTAVVGDEVGHGAFPHATHPTLTTVIPAPWGALINHVWEVNKGSPRTEKSDLLVTSARRCD